MHRLARDASTGVAAVDHLLQQVIARLEDRFPHRIRSTYLKGSFADGTAVATSDLDLLVVFQHALSRADQQRFAALRDACNRLSPYHLDMGPAVAADLLHLAPAAAYREPLRAIVIVGFKRASRLLSGQDVRPAVVLPPLNLYTHCLLHFAADVVALRRGNPAHLRVPITYPDPADAFYGYARRQVRAPDGTLRASTKNLVLSTLWIASALLALHAHQYVPTKRACVLLYRQWMNDAWTPLVEAIYQTCSQQWAYLVPDGAAERDELRRLCRHALAFENHFLRVYQTTLLADLQQPSRAQRLHAVQQLGRLIYPDGAVPHAVQALQADEDPDLQQAVRATLAQYPGRGGGSPLP